MRSEVLHGTPTATPHVVRPRHRFWTPQLPHGALGPGALACLVLLAFAPLTWVALRHAIDVPGYDQINWNIVDLIESAETGHWSWATFFLSHNEHQLLFTKLLILLNALCFDWVRPLDSLVCAAVIAAAALAFGTWARKRHGLWAAVSVVLIVASVNQWRNVTWGFMLQHGMTLLLAVCLALYCDRDRLRAEWLGGIALLGTAASGNGLVLWVIGAVLLALQAWRNRAAADGLRLAAFTAVAVAAVLWVLSTAHGPEVAGPRDPWTLLQALGSVVANPVGYLVRWGAMRKLMGLAVVLAGAVLLWVWLRRELASQLGTARSIRPLAVLVLFALGSAILVALKRDGDMLFDVKYNTSVNPLYAALSVAGLALWKARVLASGRKFSIAITALVCGAGLLSLRAAAQAERHDRANAVADYVQAMAGRGGMVVSAVDAWRGPVRPDAAIQLERLDHLELLRPSLGQFQLALQDWLQRPPGTPATPAGLRIDLLPDWTRPTLDVEGSPGVDSRGLAPDAVLMVALLDTGLPLVATEEIGKQRRRHTGSPWGLPSARSGLSGRFTVEAAGEGVRRVALVAVWLDTVQITTLATVDRPVQSAGQP